MRNEIVSGQPTTVAPKITNIQEYTENNFKIENSNVSYVTKNIFEAQNSDSFDENGNPLTPLVPTRYDSSKHVIYLGNEEIRIPVELESEELLTGQDLPYIYALCDVYAEKLNCFITPDTIDSMPSTYIKDLERQKKAFYSAEYVHHSAREVFADGEQEFQALKDDAYHGIEATYFNLDYANGYARLRAVLEKITSTTLNKSNLINIAGLIGNLEKKGICHILVNDDVIKSWVKIDE